LKVSKQLRDENLVDTPWQADVLQAPLSLLYAFQRTHQQLEELSLTVIDCDDSMSIDSESFSHMVESTGENGIHHLVDPSASLVVF
jgi:hypothetical protein